VFVGWKGDVVIEDTTCVQTDVLHSSLQELRDILSRANLTNRSESTFAGTFRAALDIPRVRTLIEWEVPKVTDLSQVLDLRHEGEVSAIRLDLLAGVGNLKKLVVAGLMLRGVIKERIPLAGVNTLTDAGNMNTGFALKYYCAKYGFRGHYIMSRLFPRDMVAMLQDAIFHVEQAPANDNLGVEEEFYRYLHKRVRDVEFRRNKHCLWHAKYGGDVLYPLGREVAQTLDTVPDYLVVSVGAGSTLTCLTAIKAHFEENLGISPKIVVVEHNQSPIFAKFLPTSSPTPLPAQIRENKCMSSFSPVAFRKPPTKRTPHFVIGPHYEKPNPLLSDRVIGQVDHVQQYTDREWMMMSHYLECQGTGIGNSSAAHVAVSAYLASKGYKVLTVIMEPMRSYYTSRCC